MSPKLSLFAAVVSGSFWRKLFAMLGLFRILALTFSVLPHCTFVHACKLATQSVPSSVTSSDQSVSPQAEDPDGDSSDDSEAKPKRAILLATISFTDTDHLTARANAFQSDPSSSPSPAELKTVLQDAVGCSLTDSPNLKVTSAYYLGSCTLPHSAAIFLRQGRVSTAPLKRYCEEHNLEILTVTFEFADTEFLEIVPPAAAPVPFSSFNFSKKQKEWFAAFGGRLSISFKCRRCSVFLLPDLLMSRFFLIPRPRNSWDGCRLR